MEREAGAAAPAEFRILGPFEVVADGRHLDIGSPKQRQLLATLAVAREQPVTVDTLADGLWGPSPRVDVASGLQNLVSKVRRVLAPTGARIAARPGAYVLEAAGLVVDAWEFERLAGTGRARAAAGDPVAAAEAYEAALARWRGPALTDFADLEFARAEAARLDGLRREATEALADALLTGGQAARAVTVLEAHTRENPYSEGAFGRLMVALYRTGRQADALAAFQHLRRTLADELGLEPGPDLRRLERQVLAQSRELDGPPRPADTRAHAPLSSSTGPPTNLPVPVGRFLGREAELGELTALIGSVRLLTLWGPGGAGKTRLSIELAARLADGYHDGVWFVELAPLGRDAQVVPTVMAAMGVLVGAPACDPLDELCVYLTTRQVLVVLDNCEHVLPAAAAFAHAVLTRCPRVTVVATSREPLAVPAECTWPAPSLSLPPEDATLAELAASDAVALFCDRARLAHPGFALSATNAAAVAEICRRLDGIPLALELAAARVRVLGVAGLVDRLDDRFRVLTGGPRTVDGRHQTLRAAVDWSYDLMPPAEQALLACLSVFPASFDLAAAEAVAGPEVGGSAGFEVFDLLVRLVDKSLVVAVDDAGGAVRYRLLETIRRYGAERLESAGTTREVRSRHITHFAMSPVTDWEQRYIREATWLDQAHREEDNYNAAFEWALADGDAGAALRIAGSLWPYWDWTENPRSRPREWLAAALALPASEVTFPRCEVMVGLAYYEMDPSLALRAVAEAAEIGNAAQVAGIQFFAGTVLAGSDPDRAADLVRAAAGTGLGPGVTSFCHHVLAWLAIAGGDVETGLAEAERAVGFRSGWGTFARANLLATVAVAAALNGQADRAEAAAEEARACARDSPLRGLPAMALARSATAAAFSGRWARAEVLLREQIPLLRRLGTYRWVGDTLELCALVFEATDRPGPARNALRAAAAHRSRVGEVRGGGIGPVVDLVTACEHRLAEGPDAPSGVARTEAPLGDAALYEALEALDGFDRPTVS